MGRKFVEHPLVVAVAMGLLAPLALPGDEDSLPPLSMAALDDFIAPEQTPELDEPSPEEFARVEHLWHQVRTNV